MRVRSPLGPELGEDFQEGHRLLRGGLSHSMCI